MGRLCERPGCSENAALTYGMRPEDLVFWIDLLREGVAAEVGVLCLRHGDTMTVPRGWTLDDLRDPDLHLFRPPPRPDGPASRRNRPRRRTNDDDTGQLALGGLVEEIDELVASDGVDTGDQAEPDGDVRSASPMSVAPDDPTESAEAVSPPTDTAIRFETVDPTDTDIETSNQTGGVSETVDKAEIRMVAESAERTVAVDATATDAADGAETAHTAPPVELNWKPAFDDGDDLDGLLAARSPLLSRAFRGERG